MKRGRLGRRRKGKHSKNKMRGFRRRTCVSRFFSSAAQMDCAYSAGCCSAATTLTSGAANTTHTKKRKPDDGAETEIRRAVVVSCAEGTCTMLWLQSRCFSKEHDAMRSRTPATTRFESNATHSSSDHASCPEKRGVDHSQVQTNIPRGGRPLSYQTNKSDRASRTARPLLLKTAGLIPNK